MATPPTPTCRRCHAGKLAYGYIYYDATVDDARLVLAVARSAAAHGAAVANRCRVVAFDHGESGRVGGATLEVGGGRTIDVAAETVVNATGVWTDEVRALEDGTCAGSIRPAKGVHLTLPWTLLRNDIAAVIPVPGDKRSLFVVPWGPLPDGTFRHTYVGTTDTDYAGPLDDPPCTSEDIDYVLGAINAALDADIGVGDITGVWAGLRPLVRAASSGRTADLSRRHRVTIGSRGVVTVTGGKLTTYRQMAEDTVDTIARLIGRGGRSRTRKLRLLGADGFTEAEPGTAEAHLDDRYGSLASMIDRIAADDADLGAPLVPGLPYLRAEAAYAARHEMATTLTDVLTRRTRAHLLDRGATVTAAPAIADLLAGELGWDSAERERQLDDYRQLVAKEQVDAMATA